VTFQFALTNGGPASIFYGSLLAGFGACMVGFSLAELASMCVLQEFSQIEKDCNSDYDTETLPLARSIVGLRTLRLLRLASGDCYKVCRMCKLEDHVLMQRVPRMDYHSSLVLRVQRASFHLGQHDHVSCNL
jgi:hypothetical protein